MDCGDASASFKRVGEKIMLNFFFDNLHIDNVYFGIFFKIRR